MDYAKYQCKVPRAKETKAKLGAQQCAYCHAGYAAHVVLARDGEPLAGAEYMMRDYLFQQGFVEVGFVHSREQGNCDRSLLRRKPDGIQRQLVVKPSRRLDEFLAAVEAEKNVSPLWTAKLPRASKPPVSQKKEPQAEEPAVPAVAETGLSSDASD